ncbi:homoserine dehydrogenase [Collinsella sp. zg1085]|uniref:homoserine dehydrogenase n=1 Tax=Collinsella sp. zg1085 TaxID=2844380 RepID=UPI001C0E3309|nr:homoserine dehydrogenase [Collinsella sp. zg1085]QWT18071.1 homoserine dehydrogenase [Collinsella sp. zg1085]
MQATLRSVGVGIIGLGTVGGGVVRVIESHRDNYRAQHNIDVSIIKACARSIDEARACGLDDARFCADWHELIHDPAIDIIVELIGGEHPAQDIIEAALAAGKHVVTANKALLGKRHELLSEQAHESGVRLCYEAAVGGGIPIICTLEQALIANNITRIAGILNGTTNYILTRMEREGADFGTVLRDAQALGYAEANPSADVDGFDAASKTALLASLGFRSRVNSEQVITEGIRSVSSLDFECAVAWGYTIKLLGIAERTQSGITARVQPTLISKQHQLAQVSEAMNAIYVVGDAVGETMFYGAGAGSFPTASAVVGDILSIAAPLSQGENVRPEPPVVRAVVPVLSSNVHEGPAYLRVSCGGHASEEKARVCEVLTASGLVIDDVHICNEHNLALRIAQTCDSALEAAVAALKTEPSLTGVLRMWIED